MHIRVGRETPSSHCVKRTGSGFYSSATIRGWTLYKNHQNITRSSFQSKSRGTLYRSLIEFNKV